MSEKSSVSNLSQKQRDLQARTDAMSVLEADIQSCIKLMEECEAEITRVEESSRKVGRHREALEGRQLEMKEVDVKEQQLLRQLANAEDKLARVRRTAVSKREAAQKQMVRIREEYNVMAQERAMRMQEMDKKKSMIEQTEKKVPRPCCKAEIDLFRLPIYERVRMERFRGFSSNIPNSRLISNGTWKKCHWMMDRNNVLQYTKECQQRLGAVCN
jgi:chromosome segregation ATPase